MEFAQTPFKWASSVGIYMSGILSLQVTREELPGLRFVRFGPVAIPCLQRDPRGFVGVQAGRAGLGGRLETGVGDWSGVERRSGMNWNQKDLFS